MDLISAVALAKEGNNEGITYLYENTYQKGYYIALKYLKNEHTAQDVLQDSYIKAFQSLNQLEDASKFEAWFGRIVATRSLNELKKNNVMLFSETENEDDWDISDDFEDDRIDTCPELAIDQQETSRLIQEMMADLSDEQRMCITMFYMEEMSVKEIAETLGVSENTVKSRLNYGRTKIKDKVLELEKKGTKLYGLLPMVFFFALFKKDALACEYTIPEFIVSSAASTTKTVAQTVVGSATKSATKTGLTIAGKSVSMKAIIGAVIAAVVIGSAGTVTAIQSQNAKEEAERIVAESQNEEESKATGTEEINQVEEEPEVIEESFVEPEGQITSARGAIYDGTLYYAVDCGGCHTGIIARDIASGQETEVVPNGHTTGFRGFSVYDGYIYCAWDKYGGTDSIDSQIYRFSLDDYHGEYLADGEMPIVVNRTLYFWTIVWDSNEHEQRSIYTLHGIDVDTLEENTNTTFAVDPWGIYDGYGFMGIYDYFSLDGSIYVEVEYIELGELDPESGMYTINEDADTGIRVYSLDGTERNASDFDVEYLSGYSNSNGAPYGVDTIDEKSEVMGGGRLIMGIKGEDEVLNYIDESGKITTLKTWPPAE